MKELTIRLETEKDYKTIENLVRDAFWNVYKPGCCEHYVLHVLRNAPDFVPELDFVMELDGEPIGQVVFVHAKILTDDGKELPIMTFGPLSIRPDKQRQGYGKILLTHALTKARETGVGAICIEGNIDFYGQCGFVTASERGIRYHSEPKDAVTPYFLLCELQPNFLNGATGTYRPPEIYSVREEDVEAFDRNFPPKRKQKLPGQLFD